MKKLLTIMTAFVLALAVAMPVMADEAVKYAKVADCTKSDSYDETAPDVTPTGSETATTTLTYNAASLKIVAEDKDQSRPAGYSWLGFTVTMPQGYTKYKLTYNGKTDENETTVQNQTFDEYVGVSPEKLEEATKAGKEYLEYKLEYEWIKDGEEPSVKQTILIKIKLAGVTLKDEQDTEVWNEDLYEAAKPEPEATKKPAATTTNKKKDPTPGTGVENVYAVAGLVAIVALAGAVVLNKRK